MEGRGRARTLYHTPGALDRRRRPGQSLAKSSPLAPIVDPASQGMEAPHDISVADVHMSFEGVPASRPVLASSAAARLTVLFETGPGSSVMAPGSEDAFKSDMHFEWQQQRELFGPESLGNTLHVHVSFTSASAL